MIILGGVSEAVTTQIMAKTSTVIFNVSARTLFGEQVYVTGNSKALGSEFCLYFARHSLRRRSKLTFFRLGPRSSPSFTNRHAELSNVECIGVSRDSYQRRI